MSFARKIAMAIGLSLSVAVVPIAASAKAGTRLAHSAQGSAR